ncbi:MAG TPA: DUF2723 domain-containing protein [Thermoanaerobaculia bacterium]|nr:DUF2723 domain-containing protein [Thermoanaerobaculia bacterium]
MRQAVAAFVFAAALVVYTITLTPTVGLTDSGALTVAAWALGNAHPPGFPLYLMLTHLATLLPLGTIAVRVNYASAFFAALACAMVTLCVAEIIPAKTTKWVTLSAMTFAGLLLAFGRTLWEYAVVAEVYALNSFLLATIFCLMLSWRRTRQIARLYIAALVFGLALGVHHVTIGLSLVAIAVLVLRTAGFKFFRSKQLLIAALIAIVAFVAVYAYLPIAASRDPVLNWGDPDNFTNIVRHITAKQYRVYVKVSDESSQVDDFFRLTTRELGPPWLPIALLIALYGLWQAFRRDRTLFWFLLLVIVADAAWMLVYPIANDEDAYLLPVFLALTLASAYGVVAIARDRIAIAAALLAIPLLSLGIHWPYRDRSHFLVPKDYSENALRTMDRDALLFTGDWQLYAPMFYFLEAEKVRPDVKIIEYGMLIRGWYVDALAKRYPELFGEVQEQFAAYRPLLAHFDADDEQWRNDAALREQFNLRLDDLVAALIEKQVAHGGHAYATADIAKSQDPVDQRLLARLAAAYDVVPRGIVMEYLPGHSTRDVKNIPLQLRGLVDARDEVVLTEILPTYRTALLNRARYFAVAGRYEDALASYKDALSLDPDNASLQAEIARTELARERLGVR